MNYLFHREEFLEHVESVTGRTRLGQDNNSAVCVSIAYVQM